MRDHARACGDRLARCRAPNRTTTVISSVIERESGDQLAIFGDVPLERWGQRVAWYQPFERFAPVDELL